MDTQNSNTPVIDHAGCHTGGWIHLRSDLSRTVIEEDLFRLAAHGIRAKGINLHVRDNVHSDCWAGSELEPGILVHPEDVQTADAVLTNVHGPTDYSETNRLHNRMKRRMVIGLLILIFLTAFSNLLDSHDKQKRKPSGVLTPLSMMSPEERATLPS